MSVALIIVYNHKHEENIEILERIYRKGFPHIYHLVPFYQGKKSNVIAVYEGSYFFQGYFAQGLHRYFKEEYTHYLFIHDDLLLNPAINEINYQNFFQVGAHHSFLPSLFNLYEEKRWGWVRDNYNWDPYNPIYGTQIGQEFPSYDEAMQIYNKPQPSKFKFIDKPLQYMQIHFRYYLSIRAMCRKTPEYIWRFLKGDMGILRLYCHSFIYNIKFHIANMYAKLTNFHYHLTYPLVAGYSDIIIVPAKNIKKFCHYCGILAATNLFVEIAIPTALMLSGAEIVTQKMLTFSTKIMWSYEEYTEFAERYSNKLSLLLKDFPKDCLYVHPVKLSQWKTEI